MKLQHPKLHPRKSILSVTAFNVPITDYINSLSKSHDSNPRKTPCVNSRLLVEVTMLTVKQHISVAAS